MSLSYFLSAVTRDVQLRKSEKLMIDLEGPVDTPI